VALMAIERLVARTLIVVPTVERLGFKPRHLGVLSGELSAAEIHAVNSWQTARRISCAGGDAVERLGDRWRSLS
jgi:hypothetical protein